MREDRFVLGSFANVPNVWRYALLRQLPKSARQQTCAGNRTSRDRFRATERALVVLLS
jgi:hypothetical protein